MKQKKYDLTISILASNRKDTLPKTLNSIKPILDNVSSELIIVDTGCDEELLAVIRQYTDKIIKFEWCKDFSKARNTGLEKAQGQWFMFIDDDEWFEDVTEFINFFNSNEKDKYGFAKYIVRNYHNMEGTEWSDSVAGRMFRILEGTKFVDVVHERPENITGPTKNFTSYAHHYGYVYKSPADKKAHFERNISLIENQVKQERHIARHYAHLVQEYCTIKEYEKVIELSEEGIQYADMNYKENEKDVPALYGMIVWALVNQHKYTEAYDRGMQYISYDNCSELAKFAIYEFIAVAAHTDGKHDRALECVEKYFEYKKYFDENVEKKYQQSAILIMEADSEENVSMTTKVGFSAASYVGDEVMLEKYAKDLDFSKRFALPDAHQVMKNVVGIMRKTMRIAASAELAERILKSQDLANMFLLAIIEMKEEDLDGFYKIADIMAMTNSNNGYVNYLRIINARNDIYADRLTGLYEKTVESVTDIINLDNDFWDIAIEKNIDIKDMINKSSINYWMKTVDTWFGSAKVREILERRQRLDKLLCAQGIHLKYFAMVMTEALLVRKKLDNTTIEDLNNQLIEYINEVMEFYAGIYTDFVFEKHTSVLPVRCQVALLLKKLCVTKDVDIKQIKTQVTNAMPQLQNILNRYEELV